MGIAECNQAMADALIGRLARHGAGLFVASPGSRSTPLTLAAARDPEARLIMHLDERGAAYFALGWVKAKRMPAVLICTSGTATANYLPAVVEASQSFIPLIILTADRPPEVIGTGANQTIRQAGIYGSFVRWEHTLACPAPNISMDDVFNTVDHAWAQAMTDPQGPVHLNCPFHEPLYAPTPPPSPVYPPLQPTIPVRISAIFNAEGPGMIIAGTLPQDGCIQETVLAMADRLGWPVVPDITSGLRLGVPGVWRGREWLLPHSESLLAASNLEIPDTILHIGGPFVSKRLATALQETRPGCYIHMAPQGWRFDPDHLVTGRISGWPMEELDESATRKHPPSPESPPTPPESAVMTGAILARILYEETPGGAALFVGNSLPIRDMNTHGGFGGYHIPIYANRGASGIDGTLATAVGAALAHSGPMAALLGDLALLHDLNSMALLQHIKTPFPIVISDNNGGGIFHHLPVAACEEVFESCFATPHGLDLAHAGVLFGFRTITPATASEAALAIRESFATPGPTLVIVRTVR